jgi:hypothetical protein
MSLRYLCFEYEEGGPWDLVDLEKGGWERFDNKPDVGLMNREYRKQRINRLKKEIEYLEHYDANQSTDAPPSMAAHQATEGQGVQQAPAQ